MQRAPCSRSPSTSSVCWYSSKSWMRSDTGRLAPFTRSSLRKPPSSPIEIASRSEARHGGLVIVLVALVSRGPAVQARDVVRAMRSLLRQRAPVVGRHHLHPAADQAVPVGDHAGGHGAERAVAVLFHERADLLEVLRARRLEVDQLGV